ncbi:hypothetical protein [Kribbella sp. NBC_01484]|uniref:hypothetical protein n=1 Tax=Kribbella sp. NBC_01484 TaxID=2903579 RepID=UPI002E31F7BC|nr:hypothetical protein [Kribbella sp. NBC_01484]
MGVERRSPSPSAGDASGTGYCLGPGNGREQARFEELTASSAAIKRGRTTLRPWSRDDWIDDLDRARLSASQQNFALASILAARWLARTDSSVLDDADLHLRGRTLMLLGDVARDQGRLTGPGSAVSTYRQALRAFGDVRAERRTAQVELLLTVVLEMSGELERSAARYRELSTDPRLSALDQARARMWVGTALTKVPESVGIDKTTAVGAIASAVSDFEELDEPDEWNVGQQKLALAYLALDKCDDAHRHIDIAQASGGIGTPLQKVKLDTARGHILLSDRATRSEGLTSLELCRELASAHQLLHQVTSIDRIIGSIQDQANPGKVS